MSETQALEHELLRRMTDEARKSAFDAVDARNSDRKAFEDRLATLEASKAAIEAARDNDRLLFEDRLAAIERDHVAAIELREKMLRALEGRVRERDEELVRQAGVAHKLRRALNDAHASTSWRVTRPLRAISHLIRKLRS